MLEPGCLIALAGQSGSGKSTIIRAIAGRIPIKEGTILVYGKPMEAIRKEERRELISYMPQGGDAVGGVLFPTTIWDNIALGLGDPRLASDQMIEEAARLAGIREYIEQLPERYQTTIGEKGISLSGGQVERILLARTLIRNTPILLLDEPTASLDEETEAAFIKQLKWLIKEQHIGVLIATHRNAVIQEADETIRL
jgi:ABC-type bacteriocin/lantibiotic exporter with double-glycine peptidase domain